MSSPAGTSQSTSEALVANAEETVVATEVRRLAGQTSRATDEIGQQIGSIQGATEKVVGAVEGIGTTIAQVNEIATAIASAVREQDAATKEIARSIRQAATEPWK